MIETDEVGQKKVDHLIVNMTDEVFNDWEQGFIRDLRNKKYRDLSVREKAIVTRLTEWLMGK